MKKRLFLICCFMFLTLVGCSDSGDDGDNYCPNYRNETKTTIKIIYTEKWPTTEGVKDSLVIAPNDSVSCSCDTHMPILLDNGLRIGEKEQLTDVEVVFDEGGGSSRCLKFADDSFQKNDIRNFSVYENQGKCDSCSHCSDPYDVMLYRITNDMLKEAEPCE